MPTNTLGQLVAIHRGVRTEEESAWTARYQTLQKESLFNGLAKTHDPDEGFVQLDPEIKRVQANATEILEDMRAGLTRLFNLSATKDEADTHARSSVLIDGQVLLPDVPVAHLLWMEKKLTDLVTVFKAIPVISPAEEWDPSTDGLPRGYRKTVVTKKPSQVKQTKWEQIVPPTDKFPAQIQQVSNDIKSGVWTTIKFTSALDPRAKEGLVRRAQQVLQAVQKAITAANHIQAEEVDEAGPLFGFIFGEPADK